MFASLRIALLFLVLMLAAGAAALRAEDTPAPLVVPVNNSRPAELPGLHNVFHLSERLYSGSVPEGDEGFHSLQRLGIRTILTVDGMSPDVERAHRFGMRYVHLPFGYDGCPVPQANRIVRAVRDLPGPVYVHCHHGKHRSPTAAEFVRIALDGITPEQAVREMQRAGTGKEYEGLYQDVRAYRPPTEAQLDHVPATFPEVARIPPLAQEMVRIDDRFSRLKAAQESGWTKADPSQIRGDALQLRELFVELNRGPVLNGRPDGLKKQMRDAEQDALALDAAVRTSQWDAAGPALGRIAAGCGTCHTAYRNPHRP